LVENFHGFDGPVTLSAPSYPGPLVQYYLRGAEEAGYPTVDLNAPYQEGITMIIMIISFVTRIVC